jgi:hypothetical protein
VPGRLSGSPTRGGERTNAIARSCGGAALTAGRKEEARRHDRCVAPDARAQSWRFLTGLPQLTPPSVDPSATNTRRAPLGSVLLLKRSGILGPSRFGICLESRVAHLAGSRSHGCLFAGGAGWVGFSLRLLRQCNALAGSSDLDGCSIVAGGQVPIPRLDRINSNGAPNARGEGMRVIACKLKRGVLVAGAGVALALSAAPAQASPSAQGLEHWHGAAATDKAAHGLALGRPAGWDTGHRVS